MWITFKGLLRSILRLPYNTDHTREVMRHSYRKHYQAAQKGKIPLSGDNSPHKAGLYGALGARYFVCGVRRMEFILWVELSPFLLMKETDAVDALAEYVVCQENPEGGNIIWLKRMINDALRTIREADPNYRALATDVLLQRDIYWRNFLDNDVIELLEDEFLKFLPRDGDIASEVYMLMDDKLRMKVNKLKNK